MQRVDGRFLRSALRRFTAVPAVLVFVVCATALASRGADGPLSPATAKQLGQFSVRGIDGKQHSPDEWVRSKAIVLFFIGTECPVSNAYAPDMQRIATKYAPSAVACYGVHCDPAMTPRIAAGHAKEYGLNFPIWLDPRQVLAGAAAVRVTPEAVVVAPTGKVLYRGRIDDRYATDGKRRDDPTVLDLENAIDRVVAGAEPAVRQTTAFGCPLPKLKPEPR
jgi:thiol-disulfide isomerase/thioredoxin